MTTTSLFTDAMRVPIVLISCAISLTGCTINQLKPSVATCLPARLNVIQLPSDVQDASVRRVFHDGDKTVTTKMLEEDRRQINDQLRLTAERVLSSIHHTTEFITDFPVSDMSLMTMGSPINQESLSAMLNNYPAEEYLRLCITDFGETPRRWKTSYITFEVVSTLAITGAFYVHRATRAIAGVYLLEESIEELSEGYAGFWALNRLSQPVRIEADLIDGRTGNILLHVKHTGMASWKWHNVWRMNDAERKVLENQSMERAVSSTLNDISNFYLKHCNAVSDQNRKSSH